MAPVTIDPKDGFIKDLPAGSGVVFSLKDGQGNFYVLIAENGKSASTSRLYYGKPNDLQELKITDYSTGVFSGIEFKFTLPNRAKMWFSWPTKEADPYPEPHISTFLSSSSEGATVLSQVKVYKGQEWRQFTPEREKARH